MAEKIYPTPEEVIDSWKTDENIEKIVQGTINLTRALKSIMEISGENAMNALKIQSNETLGFLEFSFLGYSFEGTVLREIVGER